MTRGTPMRDAPGVAKTPAPAHPGEGHRLALLALIAALSLIGFGPVHWALYGLTPVPAPWQAHLAAVLVCSLPVARDITEAHHQEHALIASERRFRTLFEQAPIGIDVVSPEGRPVRANLALRQMLGYSEAEMLNGHFADWTHPEDMAPSIRMVERLRRGEADSLSLNKRYLRKDGSTVWAHTAVAAVRNDSGETDCFIAMVEDVTEHHHKAEETRRLLDQNRHLARRLLRVQEQERRLIACELHDEVGQNLTGIRADAQAILGLCQGDGLEAARTRAAAIDRVAFTRASTI